MDKQPDEPALPGTESNGLNCGMPGMTIADVFAGQIIGQLLTSPARRDKSHPQDVEFAYYIADLMMTERAKRLQKPPVSGAFNAQLATK